MSAIIELFGRSTTTEDVNWRQIVSDQQCPFLGRQCYKVRKSDPQTSIGSCTVSHGRRPRPILICPTRLIERGQIFSDCLHLLALHEPGNELHIVSEVQVPGGSVDYFLVSARDGSVMDFAGVELQTLDTTGTVWPERQRLLKRLGVPRSDQAESSLKPFGINWKMTARTILMQMHHKIKTFEHVHKKLVLVTQDALVRYMASEFDFGHLKNPALSGHSMHLHSYRINQRETDSYRLALDARYSTDAKGIATCLGLQEEARVELDEIIRSIESKISTATLFSPAAHC